jgi:hypothetical protein
MGLRLFRSQVGVQGFVGKVAFKLIAWFAANLDQSHAHLDWKLVSSLAWRAQSCLEQCLLREEVCYL